MNSRVVVLTGAVLLLAVTAVLFILTEPRDLGGDLQPTPTSVYYQPVQTTKHDLMVQFEHLCGADWGIYYHLIAEGSDSLIGFIMPDADFKELCSDETP